MDICLRIRLFSMNWCRTRHRSEETDIATFATGSAAAERAREQRVRRALSRCLADLDMRGEVAASFDRAAEVLENLVPALFDGDPDGARAAVLGSDLPTRELLDLVLRARLAVRRRKALQGERTERERAADAALRALADRPDPARPQDRERRRQIATAHTRLLGLIPDGVLTARPNGRLVHANQVAREVLGLRLSELKDTPIASLFVRQADAEDAWSTIEDDGGLRPREADLRGVGGRSFPARLTAARADGPDPRVLVVFRDLTEIRHIRSRLLETEKLGAMAKVAGSVAHEIRNPLNALFLNADLLEDELHEAGEAQETVDHILRVMREEIERLNEIIKNYLSLSKLGHADFQRLDLNEVVRDFAEEADEIGGRSNIRIEFRGGRSEAWVRADGNMLRRVLINLVQNAIDVSPPGATVVIGTRRLVRKVKLWVRDKGPGVAPEAEDQLFQPFFSTKERGTGLGLYLSREIILAHNGQIALRSMKPTGAQATMVLPRWREEEAS